MYKFQRFVVLGVMALCLGSAGTSYAQFAGQGQGQGGWDAPPQAFNDAARRGYQDGLEGARKDYENHRQPNVNNRDEYRHPNVDKRLRRDYRMGFQRGYDAGVRHLMQGGPGRR